MKTYIGAGSEDEVGSGADEGVEGRSKKEEEVVEVVEEMVEEEEEEEEEVVVVVRSGVVEVVVVESEVVEVEVVVVVDVVVNVVVVVVVVVDDDDDDRDVVEVIDSEEVKIESVGEEVENEVAEEVDMDEEEKEGGIVGKVEDISGVDKDISSVDEVVSGVDEDVLGVEEDVSGVDKDVSGVDEDIVIVRNNHATYQHRLPLSAMIIVPRPDPDPVPPCFHVDNGDVVSYDETLNVHGKSAYSCSENKIHIITHPKNQPMPCTVSSSLRPPSVLQVIESTARVPIPKPATVSPPPLTILPAQNLILKA